MNAISTLYRDGIIKVSDIFDQSFLDDIVLAKNRIFSKYPYGQKENYEKVTDLDEANKKNYYPIKNILELEPIFTKIFENRNINLIAEEVLGKNFYFTDITMRIVPKTKNIQETHRDFCGGLSFSLLLDNIDVNQGETYFFKNSYKNPPPSFVDLNKFSSDFTTTTGKIGDVYFWLPDSWHGRNHNLTDKKNCILMCDIENRCTDRKLTKIYIDENSIKPSLFNKIFKFIGNDPNSLLKHFIYCMLRFKIFKKKIENEKIVYTRLVLKNNFSENFSYLNYIKLISLKKFLKAFINKTILLILGKKLFSKLRKVIS